MISFSKLGDYGRFGNQMFQYVFLRTQAERLKTKFYCPEWIGDNVFILNDENEKAPPFEPDYFYTENDYKHGFHPDVYGIKDRTEIRGYFQTDKYFSKSNVDKWMIFNETSFEALNKKYESIDFSLSTAVHVRLGDHLGGATTQFYIPKKSYFKNALDLINEKGNILVFSDSPSIAKRYLKDVYANLIFIEGNNYYEDFYLMTKCRNIVCSGSSFSWWTAYLNKSNDKKVIVPKYWYLPGSRMTNPDIILPEWIKVSSTRWYDHYYIKCIPVKIVQLYNKFIKKI